MMKHTLVNMDEKLLIGVSTEMSMVENTTAALWKSFRTANPEISNRSSTDFISLQQYPKDYFETFSPTKKFKKWAGVFVAEVNEMPKGLALLVIPSGLYAVFKHKGHDPSIFQYIYGEWIPNSKYTLDERPHFEVLGVNYKNNDPNSEEDIWIPIKTK